MSSSQSDLPQNVLNFVFVGGLKPDVHHSSNGLHHLSFLLDDQLVYQGQVLQSFQERKPSIFRIFLSDGKYFEEINYNL